MYKKHKGFDRKMWKVPFRQCYTHSFICWVKWTIWCHLVLKIYPTAYDNG